MQRQPSSPGSSPVELGDCVEELLKFTLQSQIDGTIEHVLGLSANFCSHLLNDDHPKPDLDRTECSRLYEDLALALWKSVSKASSGKYDNMGSLDDLEDKEEWYKLISQGGAELVKVLNSVNFELHVQEPFFTQLKDNLKTVEGRCAAGDYNRYCRNLFDNKITFQEFSLEPSYFSINVCCVRFRIYVDTLHFLQCWKQRV